MHFTQPMIAVIVEPNSPVMNISKSIERGARKLKSRVGERGILAPVFRRLRKLYHGEWFRSRRVKSLIVPEVRDTIALLYPDRKLDERFMSEALESYAMQNQFHKYEAGDFDVIFLFVLTRMMRPEVVVETGICAGRSSTAILEALKLNDLGTLYSIDLPRTFEGGGTHLVKGVGGRVYHSTLAPEADQPGWLVPDHFKGRWERILGDSNVELPKLAARLQRIDIFYHDSDHTYATMTNEMSTSWPLIPDGGLMIIDDSTCTEAYADFIAKHPHRIDHQYSGFGVIAK